jgi:hypothetical protein
MDVTDRVGEVVLQTSLLRVEVTLRPFAFVIRRAGFPLLRAGGAWAVDGKIRDSFCSSPRVCSPARSARPSSGR